MRCAVSLKGFTHAGASNVRTNLWYDAMGRVWQRWNDDSVSGEWDETLMRYVYDGNTLAQEHEFLASGNGMWIYNYVRYDRDYLHGPAGVRQRSYVGPSSYTDEFLFRDTADISAKVVRGSSVTVTLAPRMASGERQPENDLAPTTSSFTDISHLGAHGAFTESYGGGTTNPRTSGFDALVDSGRRHYLTGTGSFCSRAANNPYILDPGNRQPKLERKEIQSASLTWDGVTRTIPPCNDVCHVDCEAWAYCIIANSPSSTNPLHDFCCGGQQGLAMCPLVLNTECCLNCYCLPGDPNDKTTGRGCLCEKLAGLGTSHWPGDPQYTQLALQAREECAFQFNIIGFIGSVLFSCAGYSIIPLEPLAEENWHPDWAYCKGLSAQGLVIFILPSCMQLCIAQIVAGQIGPAFDCYSRFELCKAYCELPIVPDELKDDCIYCCELYAAACAEIVSFYSFDCRPHPIVP